MGEIVAAALVAHQPLIMLPEPMRVRLGRVGHDTTLIEPGFRLLREHLARHRVDTVVIVDTHWFTTCQHVVAGAAHFSGRYTSEEMPEVIDDVPYDFPGAPDLAEQVAKAGDRRGVPVVNVTRASLPRHYPTLNLVHYLHAGEPVDADPAEQDGRDRYRILSVSVLQTGAPKNFLDFGAAIAEAVAATDSRVAVLASGGMSHTFWPVDQQRGRFGLDPSHVISDAAREWDARILDLWAAGRHDEVVELYPDYRSVHPEGLFGHYLIMLGALGGPTCRAPGRKVSDYENALGTGQVHVVFDLERDREAADGITAGAPS